MPEMEIKILDTGFMEIRRTGQLRFYPARCPFHNTDIVSCGDWCAHWDDSELRGKGVLSLCHNKKYTIHSVKFLDERGRRGEVDD